MQVILLKNIPKVGQRGDIKKVSDGYALNKLFPQGLAELATPAKVAGITKKLKNNEAQHEAEVTAVISKIKSADGQRFEIAAKSDKTGHLYQKIDAAKVAEVIGVPITSVSLDHPLKEVGEHEVGLKVEKVGATAIVAIVAES